MASFRNKIGVEDIKAIMYKLNLDPMDRKPVSKYSLGMRQRLGVAQAIMENPELLILDEPFNTLDRDGVDLVYDLLWQMKKQGKTILLVSHYREDLQRLCDRTYEIKEGIVSECL